MSERRYLMAEVTQAMGDALKLLNPDERQQTRRQVDLVLQGTIDALKALPAEDLGDMMDRVSRAMGDPNAA